MSEPLIPSLNRAREQKINELSTHFANDDLTLEELERRIERVYKAASVADLEAITVDLRGLPPGAADETATRSRGSLAPQPARPQPPVIAQPESSRIRAILSSTRRVGRWAVPSKLEIVAILSDTRIDLTHAALPTGMVDLHVKAVMASFKLIVPPTVRVINEMHAVLSDVHSRADELPPSEVPATASTPVIRLTGTAFMAEVKIVVRRREDGVYYADDDDDDDEDD